MPTTPIKIKRLSYIGPSKEPASIEFADSATVICGASDTGKSFLVESIDFVLGSSKPLRDIPQRIGYDRLRILIECQNKQLVTIERSVEGAGYRIERRAVADKDSIDGEMLKAQHKHNTTDNLSGWLLNEIGLFGRRIKKNKDGVTISLSFRNLIDLILVSEQDIIKQTSPFQSGQYTSATSEYATLKLLLTGIDDNALVDTKVTKLQDQTSTAKIEILDALIEELERELEDITADQSELSEQYEKLGATIENVQQEVDAIKEKADGSINRRRELQLEKQANQTRSDEITDLLSRFELLTTHYDSDLERLEAIKESGTAFAYIQEGACPLCGTPPSEQKHKEGCDGDVTTIVQSAASEVEKIKLLQEELQKTRSDLMQEQARLAKQIEGQYRSISELTNVIDNLLSPTLGQRKFSFREIADKRASVGRDLEVYRHLERLRQQRDDFIAEEQEPEVESATTDLSKTILVDFSKKVEQILEAWNFPSAGQVYFDEKARDFVIGGKPRGSFGKGFRAITHAAVTVGLMEFCFHRRLPHPGMVVLDSPLLAYWKPEGADDSLVGSDLKDRFFKYICAENFPGQIIVVENEHPNIALRETAIKIDFTRNPNIGRYGFFPAIPTPPGRTERR